MGRWVKVLFWLGILSVCVVVHGRCGPGDPPDPKEPGAEQAAGVDAAGGDAAAEKGSQGDRVRREGAKAKDGVQNPEPAPPPCHGEGEHRKEGQPCCAGLLDAKGICLRPGGGCKDSFECKGKPSCAMKGGSCIQTRARCYYGTCDLFEQALPGATCDAQSGLCQARSCQKREDCAANQPTCIEKLEGCLPITFQCVSGQCRAYGDLVRGGACVQGYCRRHVCKQASDCPQKDTCRDTDRYCVEIRASCVDGICKTSSQNQSRTKMCNPTTAKCELRKCSRPGGCGTSCRAFAGSGTRCLQYEHNCSGGVCKRGTSKIFRDAVCDVKTGTCVPLSQKPCSSDSDCSRRCTQAQGACEQEIGRCVDGTCTSKKESKPGQVCYTERGVGRCLPSSCKADADCQTPLCQQAGDQCVSPLARCIEGLCLDVGSSSTQGKCDAATNGCIAYKCADAQDCEKPQCYVLGNDCIQTSSLCKGGRCRPQTERIANAICDQASQRCVAKPACTENKECGAQACYQVGSRCLSLTPSCAGGSCSSQSKVVDKALCMSGACVPVKACTKAQDCTRQCSNSGASSCIQYFPNQCDLQTGACKFQFYKGTHKTYRCGAGGSCQ